MTQTHDALLGAQECRSLWQMPASQRALVNAQNTEGHCLVSQGGNMEGHVDLGFLSQAADKRNLKDT